jgi:hypothetical protein
MKKRFYEISCEDTGISRLTVDAAGVSEFLESDQPIHSEDCPTYTIVPVYMTQEEFESLPEQDD